MRRRTLQEIRRAAYWFELEFGIHRPIADIEADVERAAAVVMDDECDDAPARTHRPRVSR